MSDILAQVVEKKRARVREKKQSTPLSELVRNVRSGASGHRLITVLQDHRGVNIIAEIKKASPSAGLLRSDFDPVGMAKSYESNGAVAISVLTEEDFFLGSLEHLTTVRRSVSVPVLRKDFIIDEYQVYESKSEGAHAILLIAGLLDTARLKDLLELAESLGLDALVETHTLDDVRAALSAGAKIIGVNNRNLKTFQVDLKTSLDLAAEIPKNITKVSESGIKTYNDIVVLQRAGFNGFLIGEQFMRAHDPGDALRNIRGGR